MAGLTTEHFALQSTASTTVSESGTRASLHYRGLLPETPADFDPLGSFGATTTSTSAPSNDPQDDPSPGRAGPRRSTGPPWRCWPSHSDAMC
jgi:hypothetical protein